MPRKVAKNRVGGRGGGTNIGHSYLGGTTIGRNYLGQKNLGGTNIGDADVTPDCGISVIVASLPGSMPIARVWALRYSK